MIAHLSKMRGMCPNEGWAVWPNLEQFSITLLKKPYILVAKSFSRTLMKIFFIEKCTTDNFLWIIFIQFKKATNSSNDAYYYMHFAKAPYSLKSFM